MWQIMPQLDPCHDVRMTTTWSADTAAGPPPNRRERKKQETRDALERAAIRLFAEKGYEQTTVEEIADAADVAVRTFFRYFASKQHVLFGDVAYLRPQRLRDALHARPGDEPPLTSVRATLDHLDISGPEEEEQILVRLRLMEQQPSLRGTYLVLIDELRQVMARFVADRSGLPLHSHPYPMLVAAAATASWETALTVWAGSGGQSSLTELRHQAWDVLTTAVPVTPPAGQ